MAHSREDETGGQEAAYGRDPVADPGLVAAAFDDAPSFIYVKDLENRFLYVNLPLCRLFGRPRSEILGRTTHEMLPAHVAEQHKLNDEAVIAAAATLRFEETFEAPDGVHSCLTVKYPLRAEDGGVAGVCGISTDITEHPAGELPAVLGQFTLAPMLDAIAESVLLLRVDGTVLAINRTGAERLRRTPAELIGKSMYDLLPPEVSAGRAAMIERAAEGGEPVVFQDERAGRTYTHTIYPVRVGGIVDRVAVFGRDVTELHEAQQRLVASEAAYRLLAENASDVVFRGDAAGVFEWVSPSVTALLGWLPDELVGQPFFDLVHPDDEPRVRAVRENLATGAPGRYEVRVRTAAGDYRWVAVVVRDVVGESGAVARVGGWRDIEHEVEARRALAESEERYRTLTETSPDFIFLIGRDLRLRFANRVVAEAFGRDPGSLAGMSLADLFGAETAARMRAGLETVFASGEARHTEVPTAGPWGTRWLATWLVPVRGPSGTVEHVYGVSRDIDELKRAEQDLAALNAELERRVEERTAQLKAANEELEAFAWAVSHDLRAPLRAVDGFSELVLEDEGDALSEEGRADLERVRAGAQRMGKLIDALLALSRLGRKPISVGRVDLSRLARRLAGELAELDPGRAVDVRIAPGCKVTSDADLLEVVLANLLGNAWKFTAGRDPAHVEFGELQQEDGRVFYVRDDGAGFDPAHAERLFQPFQRLHPEGEYPGTGIGLATVRRTVTRLGGRCWAEGEPGRGATFFFTVPDPAE